jgi:hypothetical protein
MGKHNVMATNIVETIQKNLGYAPLQKVDPNSQEIKGKLEQSQVDKLAQAAIPAVAAAIFKFTRTDEDCNQLISGVPLQDSLSVIYGGKEQWAVEKVAHYAGVPADQAESHMENIADEAVKIVKDVAGKDKTTEKVKTYMNGQRHNILVYLPAALQLGDVLGDETVDDRTNKMEGPVSNFMHKIENVLSGGDNNDHRKKMF